MSPGLKRLTRICPPNREPVASVDWAPIESIVGRPIPHDLKEVVSTYGTGCFDDFVWTLQPGSSNRNLDMLERMTSMARVLEIDPGQLEGSIQRLVPFAGTDNGDTCFIRLDEHGDGYEVVVAEVRSPYSTIYQTSVAEWLADILTGSIHDPAFPEDFPSPSPEYLVEG